MKKTIKTLIILVLLLIPMWLIFDQKIIRFGIIKALENTTKKETHLKRVNIHYFPELSLELIEFKLPNPVQDNYLLTAQKLNISLDANALFKKSLILNTITSSEATLFDVSEIPKPIENKKEPTPQSSTTSKIKSILHKSISRALNITNNSEIVSSIKKTFDFSEENKEINSIVDQTSNIIKEKKELILKKTNTTLYKVNEINIDSINSIDQLTEKQKTILEINSDYDQISKEINELETIHLQSMDKINAVNKEITDKIETSVTKSPLMKKDNENESLLNAPLNSLIDILINKIKKRKNETKKKKDYEPIGKTYYFNKKEQPRFLIKKLELNAFESEHYVKGLNLTTSKINNELKLYIKLTNQTEFEKFILNISSEDKEQFYINGRFRNIKINQTKLYENDDVLINFLKNNETNIDIKGHLSSSSNINVGININQPNYRVINKKASKNILSEFIPYLNNQDLEFFIDFNGNLNEYNLKITSNLDPILNEVKTSLSEKKLKKLNEENQQEIKRLKKEHLENSNNRQEKLNESFKKTLNQLKFQKNEILNEKETLERRINQKKVYIENSVKETLETSIKKIKLN